MKIKYYYTILYNALYFYTVRRVCLKSNVQLVPNENTYDLSMTPTVTAKQTSIEKVADGTDNYSIEDLFNIERSR